MINTKQENVSFSRQNLHEQIVHHIGLRVLRGEFVPGQTLPTEPELCAQMQVSRPILREAMKVLAAKGLIEMRPKTGTKVCPRNQWNLLDADVLTWQCETEPGEAFFRNLCEVRLIVEPAATRLAAQRATSDEIAELETWYQRMDNTLAETERFIDADMQFHAIILAACHNELLQEMSSTISIALRSSRMITTQVAGTSEASMPLHKAIVDAIKRQDADAAEMAMKKLVTQTTVDVSQALQLAQVRQNVPEA